MTTNVSEQSMRAHGEECPQCGNRDDTYYIATCGNCGEAWDIPRGCWTGQTRTIYLATRYNRNDEMRRVRDVLVALSYQVTSRWIDCHAGKYLTSFTTETLNADPEYCSGVAHHDLEDLRAADTVISFTSGGDGKGGRHVEFGLAIGLRKRLILVGPREHVFHTLPQVEHFESWDQLVMALTPVYRGSAS
jgi:hypothetical protein